MPRGFDAMEDTSPFMTEPAYDSQRGRWMTNEMRVHLKILQTGTVNQVDLDQVKDESDLQPEDAPEAMTSQPQTDPKCDWAFTGAHGDIGGMGPKDPSSLTGFRVDAAIQCTLLRDPPGHDRGHGSNDVCAWTHEEGFEPQEQYVPMDSGTDGEQQEGFASRSDGSNRDPLACDGDGHAELSPSGHLVRLSRPIAWSQRRWLPFPDSGDSRGW